MSSSMSLIHRAGQYMERHVFSSFRFAMKGEFRSTSTHSSLSYSSCRFTILSIEPKFIVKNAVECSRIFLNNLIRLSFIIDRV